MAKTLAANDAALICQLDETVNHVRTVMLFARRMRQGDYEINAETLKLIEDWLFIAGMDLTGARAKINQHLAEYRHIAEAIADIVTADDTRSLPTFGNIIVFTGSYRPAAANDQLGGAA